MATNIKEEIISLDSDDSPKKEIIKPVKKITATRATKRKITYVESEDSELDYDEEIITKKTKIKKESQKKTTKKDKDITIDLFSDSEDSEEEIKPKKPIIKKETQRKTTKVKKEIKTETLFLEQSENEVKPKIKRAAQKKVTKVKKEIAPKIISSDVEQSDDEPKQKKPKIVKEKAPKKPTKARKESTTKHVSANTSTKNDIIWHEIERLAEKENIDYHTAKALLNMFEAGDTIPFIARYRKAITNDMSAEKLREIKDSYEEICACKKKADNIITAIIKTGNFTPAINDSILKCKNMEELEYVYAPFKSGQKRTLAERAKQLGLEDSAIAILKGTKPVNINSLIKPNEEGLKNREEVEKGLMHIITQVITSETETLEFIRKLRTELRMMLECKKAHKELKNEAEKKFQNYFDYKIPLQYIKPHQTLAINRGENLKILSVKINIPDYAFNRFQNFVYTKYKKFGYEERLNLLKNAIEDSYKRKVQPLIVRQTRAELNVKAEKASVEVFAMNLKKLLLVSPLKGKVIMGIDPGFKVGCKVAVISELNDVLDTAVIYPNTASQNQKDSFIVKDLLQKHNCSLITIGNGTACRETETWLSNLIKSQFFSPLDVSYTIIDECGASIYSCSPEAKKEFPDLDPLLISAVSLARRVQDPLAEMVKVDPQHLGVGMYQHDVNKKLLENTLNEIVSECVSFVGVDLNTASQCLLRRVAGLTDLRATNILKHRSSHGPFTNRWQIKDVKGIGDKIFEQCAGFLRVGPSNTSQAREFYEKPDANPFDCTWIHPESYDVAEKIVRKFGFEINQVGQSSFINNFSKCLILNTAKSLSEEFNTPESTIQLILDALSRPFDYDLRSDCSHKPIFRKEITSLSDLAVDMTLTGHIRNVTSFGAFVDIGVGVNGLIHQSAMGGFNLQLGDKVEVKVINLEINRQRIGLAALNVI